MILSGIDRSDTPTAYPVAGQQTATYNNLNQLPNLSDQALTYNPVGNLLQTASATSRPLVLDSSNEGYFSCVRRERSSCIAHGFLH